MGLYDVDKAGQDRGSPMPNGPDLAGKGYAPHFPVIAPYSVITGSLLLNSTSQDIQAAIDAMSARGGGVVAITNGTHLMTSNISVPTNVTLTGETAAGAILDAQSGQYQIQVMGTLVYSSGTVAINNNATTVTGTGTNFDSTLIGLSILIRGRFFGISAVTDGTHLTINQPFDADTVSGIVTYISNPTTGAILQNFTIQNSTHPTGAILFQDTNTCGFVNITAISCTIGANFNRANNQQATGFAMLSCGTGIQVVNSAVWTMYNFICYGSTGANLYCNSFYNTSVSNATLSSATGNNATLIACDSWGFYDFENTTAGGKGIELTNCTDIEIFAMTIRDAASDGIKLTNGCARVSIHNVSLKNNGGYAVNIASSTTDRTTITSSYFVSNTAGTVNNAGTNTLQVNNN